MAKEQLEELEKHGSYFSVPHGISMKPMIKDLEGIVEIRKLEGEAKRYDVVLYERKGDKGVIHRVLCKRKGRYIIVGDNCWRLEFIPEEKVHGIAVRFFRNGKWYDCKKSVGYRIYSHIWTDLYPVRYPIFRFRDFIKRKIKKRAQKKKG